MYRHQVDAKGGVAVPARYRQYLPSGSVLAVGTDGRLVMYPPDEWLALVERYKLTTTTPAEERWLSRKVFSTAQEIDFDAQGRIVILAEHRAFAQIGDRVVFSGMGNVVEVIGEALWDAENGPSLDPAEFTEIHDRANQRANERGAQS